MRRTLGTTLVLMAMLAATGLIAALVASGCAPPPRRFASDPDGEDVSPSTRIGADRASDRAHADSDRVVPAHARAAFGLLAGIALGIVRRRRRPEVAVKLLYVMVLGLLGAAQLGCRPRLTGAGSNPSLGNSNSSPDEADPCSSCLADARTGRCAATVATCDDDARCTGLAGCFLNCAAGDFKCQAQCQASATPGAVSELGAVGQCICGACADECATQCGAGLIPDGGTGPAPAPDLGPAPPSAPDLGPAPPPSGDPCDACVASAQTGSCASTVQACASDPDCAQLAACYDQCAPDDFECQWSCEDQAPQYSSNELDAVDSCFCSVCAAQCASQCS